MVNAGGNGNIPARYQDRYQNGADELVLVFCDTEKKPHEQYEDIKRKPEGSTPVYRITYKECIQMVGQMKDFFETDVFGVEKEAGKTDNESIEIIMALHRFYITTVYNEMNQPCAHWARSWFSHYGVRRNPVASGEWFESIPHFFVQKMHRLLSCLKYQGRVLQEEREDKKNEYDCFNG